MVNISETRTEDIARELLVIRGWNPAQPPKGHLLWKNECRNYPKLLEALKGKGKQGRGGDGYPDFMVVSSDACTPLIVGEAKANERDIGRAVLEASDYGEAFHDRGMDVLAAGIAGNDKSNIAVSVKKRGKREWLPIAYRETPIQWIPTLDETVSLLHDRQRFDLAPKVPTQEILAKFGDEINRIFRQCKIKDEYRPAVIGAFMLALWQSKGNIRMEPEHILADINSACRKAFVKANKSRLAESILVPEANQKLAEEAPRIVYRLRLLNITTLTSEHDYLGQLYESFFRFTGGNTIGQYFTPRHVTQFMTELLNVGHSDYVIDLACGTGGFLVSSLHRMIQNKKLTHAQISEHVAQHLRGFESEPITAALCVANMILRGDGTTGIVNGDCFTDGEFPLNKTTIALGNPPFPHKKSDDPSEKFVNRALEALQPRGQLAFIIPGSLLVKSNTQGWRDKILAGNTLKAVITLPDELFQPYAAATTSIVVLEKGVPHRANSRTFFCRIANDGFKIKKNVRVEQKGEQLSLALHAYHEGMEIPGFCARKHCGGDEWSPGAFIDAATPKKEELREEVDLVFRHQTAFCALHAQELAAFREGLKKKEFHVTTYAPKASKTNTKSIGTGTVADKFHIYYGQRALHAKDWLSPGRALIISSSGTDNGCYGFFDYSELLKPPFVTVPSTGSIGEAFVQTWPCGVTDDCLILVPKADTAMEDLYLAAAVIRLEKWRFNYGRKITPGRIGGFLLPKSQPYAGWMQKRLAETKNLEREIIGATSDDSYPKQFASLVKQWKEGRGVSGAVSRMAMHPAYQRIIGAGTVSLPLILAEMEREPDHWFWALNAITGHDPVPKEARGKLPLMAAAWLQWGKEHGFRR